MPNQTTLEVIARLRAQIDELNALAQAQGALIDAHIEKQARLRAEIACLQKKRKANDYADDLITDSDSGALEVGNG